MKHTSLSLIGIIIIIILETIISYKVETLKAVTTLQIFYNNALDNATADALFEAVDMDCVDAQQVDYSLVTNSFYDYLAMNLGLTRYSRKAQMIPIYVPVIIYVVNDGYYYACLKEKPSGRPDTDNKRFVETEKRPYDNSSSNSSWNTALFLSDFIPFQSLQKNYQIFYTLSNRVTVIDRDSEQRYDGTYFDLRKRFTEVLPSSEEEFDTERRIVINKQIEDTMNDCLQSHNKIATHYGIRYQFSLPVIEKEEWYNTVNDISMITLFQAYPYGTATLGYYNRVAISGARLHKK